MAEDNDPESQTEDPTQKRLDDALERGARIAERRDGTDPGDSDRQSFGACSM